VLDKVADALLYVLFAHGRDCAAAKAVVIRLFRKAPTGAHPPQKA
jgi:hypothetical protein